MWHRFFFGILLRWFLLFSIYSFCHSVYNVLFLVFAHDGVYCLVVFSRSVYFFLYLTVTMFHFLVFAHDGVYVVLYLPVPVCLFGDFLILMFSVWYFTIVFFLNHLNVTLFILGILLRWCLLFGILSWWCLVFGIWSCFLQVISCADVIDSYLLVVLNIGI